MEFLSSSHNETSPLNSTTKWQSPDRRQATDRQIHRRLSTQSLDQNYPAAGPTPSPTDMPTQGYSTQASAQVISKPPVSPIGKKPMHNATGRGHHKPKLGRNQRTFHALDKSELSTLGNLNGNVTTLLASYGEPIGSMQNSETTVTGNADTEERYMRTDDQTRQTHDFKNMSSSFRHDGVPHLDLTDVQYSHRGPPSIRGRDSTDFKANVW